MVATLGGSPALLATEPAGTGTTVDGKPYILDVISLNSGAATGTFANAGPGVGITVTTSGYVLTGGDAFDYTISQPPLLATKYSVPPTPPSKGMNFFNITQTTFTI